MKNTIISLLIISIFSFHYSFAQNTFDKEISEDLDIVTVMQYNLLAYSSSSIFSGCDETTNSITDKDEYIKTITQYIKPDIFTVNEISANISDHDRLMTNCLNINNVSSYKRAKMTNSVNSSIVNQLYYRSDKFSIISENSLTGQVRDINIYKLKYYKKDNDDKSIYLTCIVAHLKAGSDDADQSEKASATSSIMSYIKGLSNVGNILVMGDFNLYSSYEEAYQNMISPSTSSITMNDPINKPGDWNNSGAYSSIHTQSTHSSSNGCASTGGMDDRFDFILASNDIMNGASKIEYVTSSYKAVGQDGLHYNDNLTDSPDNGVVSYDVADALFNNSDHLPVTLKLKMTTSTSSVNNFTTTNGLMLKFKNPSSNNLKIKIENFKNYGGNLKVDIYSVLGQQIFSDNININYGLNEHFINLNNTQKGMYIINFTDNNNNVYSEKLIIE